MSLCRSLESRLCLLVVIGCFVLSACGGGSNSQNAQVLNLGGNWQASTISNLGFNTFLSGSLNQTGDQISGIMSISGSPCATSGVLSGSVSGSRVNLSLTEGSQSVALSGTASPDGNSMSGSYWSQIDPSALAAHRG